MKQCRMVSCSRSALEVVEPGEKNEGQIFLITPAAESLCINHYPYGKMNKKIPPEWMETFKFLHELRKHDVHRLRKGFVNMKPGGVLSRNLHTKT